MAHNSRHRRQQIRAARREARKLFGFGADARIHQMPDGTWMPGFDHADYQNAIAGNAGRGIFNNVFGTIGNNLTAITNPNQQMFGADITPTPSTAQQANPIPTGLQQANQVMNARPKDKSVAQMAEELRLRQELEELQAEVEARVAAAQVVSQNEVYELAMQIAMEAMQVVNNRDMQN